MHLTSALAVVAILSGKALGAINCTVAAPVLSKRLCESNACPVHQTVVRGDNLHAACRAYCSTNEEPWIKLYDGTYVLASKETVSGCRNFCQPYSVQGLPICEEKTVSCHHSSLKPRTASPLPLGAEPAPSFAIAAKCGIPLSPAVPDVGLARHSLQSRSPRPTNSTLSARAVNGTLLARGVNETDVHVPAGIFPPNLQGRSPSVNSTTLSARRVDTRGYGGKLNATAAGGWTTIVRRSPDVPLNATLAASASHRDATTANPPGHAERNVAAAAAEPRSVSDPAFRNGTWGGAGAVGRRSPKVLRKLKFWA